jgi:hypothetical protein
MGTTAVSRVSKLLGRLAAKEETERQGKALKPAAISLFNKFIKPIESVFDSLPRPVEWRSFYNNDLPLVTKIDAKVREWRSTGGVLRADFPP